MVRLHATVQGKGPDLVLLHGWGMNSTVWEPVLPALTAGYRVTSVDLPGHGRSPVLSGSRSAVWLDALFDVAPAGAAWLGWSLGGMLALAAADSRPDDVAAVVTVASNLRFVASGDWPEAVSPELLQDIATGVTVEPVKTLQRFVALQFLATRDAKALSRRLREEIAAARPAVAGLEAGLDVLRSIDNRARLQGVQVAIQMLFGQKDKLVPVAVANSIAELNPDVDIQTIANAGHAPFLTHPAAFLAAVKPFLAAYVE